MCRRAAAAAFGRIASLCLLLLGSLAAGSANARETRLTSVGSDTLGELMLRWIAAFHAQRADVQVQLQTPGSGGAPPALAAGSADLGPMSRGMNADEEADYRRQRGQAPSRIRIGLDAVAVFVHPDNPLQSLSRRQLDAVWSRTQRCGPSPTVTTWQDLQPGTTALSTQGLLRVGRNTASGTFEFFRDTALCAGAYRDDVVQLPGAGAVVAAVAAMPHAIGHAGVGHSNGLVKILPIRPDESADPVAPTVDAIAAGRYPLARPLYIYFNRAGNGKPAEAVAAFLHFALSPQGQALLGSQGFVALPPADLLEQQGLLQ